MIIAATVVLIFVHGPGGQEIEVSAHAISSLRTPRVGEHFAPGTKCLIAMLSGKFITTRETCNEIVAKLGAIK